MEYRQLGRTGLRCSAVGLGSWAFNSQVYGQLDQSQAMNTIHAALDQGINFFDTAPLYGSQQRDGIAEEILGKGLQGRRHEVFISTKFGRKSTDGNQPNFNAAYARQSLEESLMRLATDHVDVLFFHSPFGPEEIDTDIWAGLAQLKDEGKVRYIGHSISKFVETEAMARDWAAARRIDVIQVVYSLLNRQATQLIADLGEMAVGIVARESLANGFLSGQVTRETIFPAHTLNARYSREEVSNRVEQVERLAFLLRDEIQSMPQAAMRWVLDNKGVSLVLTGACSAAELAECAVVATMGSYSAAELTRAIEVHQQEFSAA